MEKNRPEGWLSRSHKQGRPWFRRGRLAYIRWRHGLDGSPPLALAYRVVIGTLGAAVVLLGLVLVPLPGPGWLIVLTGVAIVSSEFRPARRLLAFARRTLRAWTRWVRERHWSVGAALATGTFLFVVAITWLILRYTGLPGWVPGAWVPGWTGLE